MQLHEVLKVMCLSCIFYILFNSCSKPLDVVAIDHLPSVLPRESSERFASKMTPYLLKLVEVRRTCNFVCLYFFGGALFVSEIEIPEMVLRFLTGHKIHTPRHA